MRSEVTVYHQIGTDSVIGEIVAEVKTCGTDEVWYRLETAYHLTQTIDYPWWTNREHVTPLFDGRGCRSSMVGDVFGLWDGETKRYFKVAFAGFEEINAP